MLFRKIQSVIENHLKSNSDKILLIDGVRQVGKTFIIREVVQDLFPNFIEINMIEDYKGDKLFSNIKSRRTEEGVFPEPLWTEIKKGSARASFLCCYDFHHTMDGDWHRRKEEVIRWSEAHSDGRRLKVISRDIIV